MDKITIITVVFNDKIGLEKTINSVISQTYRSIEYIVIDGGSTDGTLDVVYKYIHYISYFVSEPDMGIYDAMNKAINIASGDYLNFLNAGDIYAGENILERVLSFMDSDYAVIFGDIIKCKNKKYYIEKATEGNLDNHYSLNMGFNHQASFVLARLAKEYPFELKYKLAADFNMMRTLYGLGYKFVYCGFPIAVYDITGVSSTQISKHRYECLMIVYPSRPQINKVLASLIGLKVKMKEMIAAAIRRYFPVLLDKYYSCKSDFQLVEYNNQDTI